MIQQIKNHIKRRNNFIDIRRINFNAVERGFKYPRKNLKIVLAVSCASLSFIIPDLSAGLFIGLCLLSPLSLKHAIKNKVESIKDKLIKRYYLMRLRI